MRNTAHDWECAITNMRTMGWLRLKTMLEIENMKAAATAAAGHHSTPVRSPSTWLS